MKKILLLLIMSTAVSFAQSKKNSSVTFQTSAKCGMCKMRLERDMSLAKGVKNATLDLETKKMTIEYKSSKTNVAMLKKEIAQIGYDADEIVANQKSHDALPACCRKSAQAHAD